MYGSAWGPHNEGGDVNNCFKCLIVIQYLSDETAYNIICVQESSVADPKIDILDPDPICQVITDPDPNRLVITDPYQTFR